MDDREKLIELLARYFAIGDSYEYSLTRVKEAFEVGTMSLEDFVEFDDEKVADIADYLLANDVTVQKWIPVTEPPRDYRDEYGELIPFLVCVERTQYPFRAMYDGKTWGDGIYSVPVKFWMPLPEPPKGDDNGR